MANASSSASGGVFGTVPSAVVPGAQVGAQLPAGTTIALFTGDTRTPLYSYTATTNGPWVIPSGVLNTGYVPFQQYPIYLSYRPSGFGTTIFSG